MRYPPMEDGITDGPQEDDIRPGEIPYTSTDEDWRLQDPERIEEDARDVLEEQEAVQRDMERVEKAIGLTLEEEIKRITRYLNQAC